MSTAYPAGTTVLAAEGGEALPNPFVVVPATLALIIASAFFVAVEFSVISARRHRLEDAATTSPAARAALRNSSELSMLLAGSQLGITLCTLALGSVTKPAVHHWLTPLLTAVGLPHWIADAAAFVLALIIVTFLHLVVGEMAPKSWSIAHPEYSATLLAMPMRGFLWLTRPLLVLLNAAANGMLHRLGLEAVDEVGAGQDAEGLRELVRHSGETGDLDDTHQRQLLSALELQELTMGDLLAERDAAAEGRDPHEVPAAAGPAGQVGPRGMSAVTAGASPERIREVARATGHLRLLVMDDGVVVGVVHVRDSLEAPAGATAAGLMRPSLSVPATVSVPEAFRRMREARAHLVVIERDRSAARGDASDVRGVLTLDDVVRRLLPVAR